MEKDGDLRQIIPQRISFFIIVIALVLLLVSIIIYNV